METAMPPIRFSRLLAGGFASMLGLLALTLSLSVLSLFSIRAKVENVAQERAPKVAIAQKLVNSLLETRFLTHALLTEDEPDAVRQLLAGVAGGAALRRQLQASLQRFPLADAERSLVGDIAARQAA